MNSQLEALVPVSVFSDAEIRSGSEQLDQLSKSEYGQSIREILQDQSLSDEAKENRLCRLGGIMVKSSFGYSRPISELGMSSNTGAANGWLWYENDLWRTSLEDPGKSDEVRFLQELKDLWAQDAGVPTNRDDPHWETFKADLDHERGLFKYIALYIHGRVTGSRTKSFQEILNAPESPNFGLTLDLAELAVQSGIVAALSPIIPSAGLAVAVSVIVSRFGYAKFAQRRAREMADDYN